MKNVVTANEGLNKWCGTEDINYYEGIEALGFLFKYAVPKLTDKYGGVLFVLPQSDMKSWECRILNKPSDEATFGHSTEDPALALFWALYEVMKEGK